MYCVCYNANVGGCMKKEYLKQLFKEDRISAFRQEVAKQIPLYSVEVMIHDVSNVGRLVLSSHSGQVCAEFNISNFDCKRTPVADCWYEHDADMRVDDSKIRNVYVLAMSSMFTDYLREYSDYKEAKAHTADAQAAL